MKNDYLQKIEQCIVYIEANLKQKILIEDVLEHTYYSYPHFYRIFMDIVGDPMTFYIRKRKLSCTAIELINTQKSIVDIALDYNFSSQQTFNRAFTGYFGISPLKYRERGVMADLYTPYVLKEHHKDLIPISVSIEELKPMRVVSYHSYSDKLQLQNNNEEQERLISKAWNHLIRRQMGYEYQKQFGTTQKLPSTSKLGQFMIEHNLHVPPNTRYFGFIHPYPRNEHEFGYEAWAMVPNHSDSIMEEMNQSEIEIKDFDGGLYATAMATYGLDSNLDEVWKSLHYWLAEHEKYQYGEHQWLEEHITKISVGGFHGFKLYLPIKSV